MSNFPWITVFRPNPGARLILYCFCHAGGGIGTYRRWPERLGRDIEVRAVALPPADGRAGPPVEPRMPVVVRSIAHAMHLDREVPFALFGHSMGSLIAFELARLLRREHGVEPMHLFAAAARAPQYRGGESSYHTLPDQELIPAVRARWNGIPDQVLQEPELLALLLPNLRRDIELFETYAYREEPPLACPISVWCGEHDTLVEAADIAGWRAQTTGAFEQRVFGGGHFFIESAAEEVISAVGAALAVSLVRPETPAPSQGEPARSDVTARQDARSQGAFSMGNPSTQRSIDEIQEWLVTRIAGVAEIPEDEVEIDRPFVEFGLRSVDAVQLLKNLEQWLGFQIPPVAVWYYPTITALADHLAKQSAGGR